MPAGRNTSDVGRAVLKMTVCGGGRSAPYSLSRVLRGAFEGAGSAAPLLFVPEQLDARIVEVPARRTRESALNSVSGARA